MRPYTTEHLCVLAIAYCGATGIAPSGLSAKVTDDTNHKLFTRLLEGKTCTAESAEKASRWFTENWPDDTPWPDDVPAPTERAA